MSGARWRPAACPTCFAGGRPVADDHARAQAAVAWNVIDLPAATGPRHVGDPGRGAYAVNSAALLIGGVEPADLPDPAAALAAIDAAPFVVSLELRESAVTELADVVFPVAPVVEKSGAFLNWEGRIRPFEAALPTNATSDARVLQILADELGIDLAVDSDDGRWDGPAPGAPDVAARPAAPGIGEAVLSTWRMLLDAGRLQDGEPHLAGTARPPVVRLSAATAAEIRAPTVTDGDRAHRPRRDHAAAGDHRHARPGGVGADELPR